MSQWDHFFSEKPKRLFIEPKPGGGFFEIFDEEGNGARHAVVTYAKRGEELQFTGPLGFASLGVHFDMVHRVTIAAEGESTRVKVSVRGVGEIQEGWAAAVQGVWGTSSSSASSRSSRRAEAKKRKGPAVADWAFGREPVARRSRRVDAP